VAIEPVALVAYGQQIAAFVIFLLQLIPFVYLLRKKIVKKLYE